ncbi:MAG: YebC/PmpR family DNA-binding transcriptional regulator [Acidimicrobiales bacterium]
MSGHSKWATIKHKKGAADKARAKVFAKVLRQVEVAAREGGSDLTANATLRTMFQKARDASVPMDTIERAIKRGTGELEGVRYESITYEGYAPAGVAVLVECLTDNRNRTGAEVRAMFSKNGGSIAEPGAVAWQFERKGILALAGGGDADEVMMAALEAGAEDLVAAGVSTTGADGWQVTTAPTDLARVRTGLEQAGFSVSSADLVMIPTSLITLSDETEARRVLKVVDIIDEHDDVQAVYANFDISDEVAAALED